MTPSYGTTTVAPAAVVPAGTVVAPAYVEQPVVIEHTEYIGPGYYGDPLYGYGPGIPPPGGRRHHSSSHRPPPP